MNYQQLGLKAGIEIHQQLEGKKLFCDCGTVLRDDQPHFLIKRQLRAVAGESGAIDLAALQEQIKNKNFVYQGYNDTTCLVEIDCEPPHSLNKEALYTTLQFCQFVQAKVSSVVQVMRKTVVDGSNTSGFQRTALIARGGKIRTSQGEIKLENISLEEDACRIISETDALKTYRLDRLGIPLIEIGTAAEIKSPEECREVARKLGMLLRSLPGVKRGLGTIRQDVNVSITNGNRVEIKGAQDLKQLPQLVEWEAKRQQELIKIKEELKGVKLIAFKIYDLTFLFSQTSSHLIEKAIKNKGLVLGLKLNGFAGFIGRELQPSRRLGTEFSERAKQKTGLGGLFHSDELPNYGLTEKDVDRIKKELKCSPKDAFVLVAEVKEKAEKALAEVYFRAEEVLEGVSKEVRKANADGTTSYLRTMPSSARMYPETDVPLIFPQVKEVKVPETLEKKMERYQQQLSLSRDLAEFVAKSDKVFLFEELVEKHPSLKPAFIAETLTSTLLEIRRKYDLDTSNLTNAQFRELFDYLSRGQISKGQILTVLIDLIKGQFDLKKYQPMSVEELRQIVKEVVLENKDAPFNALMGLVMKKTGGKVSGQIISEELKKRVNG